MNLTKTVRKAPINLELERVGAATDDVHKPEVKYDDEGRFVSIQIDAWIMLSIRMPRMNIQG